MALFKIKKGSAERLPDTITDGVMYLCLDDGRLYVDHGDTGDEAIIGNGIGNEGIINRICINDYIQRSQADYILYDGGNASTIDYDIYLDGGSVSEIIN